MPLSLKLEPVHNSYVDILNCFNKGKPLSPAQLNFLRRYHAKLSDPTFDRILNYYKITDPKTFVISKNLNRSFLGNLRSKIIYSLKDSHDIRVQLSSKQFFQFKSLLYNELIFFHGNQILTGAPYFTGGVPHVDFIQWGNLFGVIKYEELVGESALDGNILIHFEEMANLKFEQCIELYFHQYSTQKQPQPQPQPYLEQNISAYLPIPRLTLSRHY
jgi:hypothetical protein